MKLIPIGLKYLPVISKQKNANNRNKNYVSKTCKIFLMFYFVILFEFQYFDAPIAIA